MIQIMARFYSHMHQDIKFSNKIGRHLGEILNLWEMGSYKEKYYPEYCNNLPGWSFQT